MRVVRRARQLRLPRELLPMRSLAPSLLWAGEADATAPAWRLGLPVVRLPMLRLQIGMLPVRHAEDEAGATGLPAAPAADLPTPPSHVPATRPVRPVPAAEIRRRLRFHASLRPNAAHAASRVEPVLAAAPHGGATDARHGTHATPNAPGSTPGGLGLRQLWRPRVRPAHAVQSLWRSATPAHDDDEPLKHRDAHSRGYATAAHHAVLPFGDCRNLRRMRDPTYASARQGH